MRKEAVEWWESAPTGDITQGLTLVHFSHHPGKFLSPKLKSHSVFHKRCSS
jgi:hypothetical protein